MNNQFNGTYFLVDAGQRIILLADAQHQTTLFVQRSILDTKVLSLPVARWRSEIQPAITSSPGFYSLANRKFTPVIESDVAEITKQKIKRARLLAEGYGYLLWYANMATEAYWSTSSVDFNDIWLLQTARSELVDLYAQSKGISKHEALKQIEFDEQNLRTLSLRRKQILWMYEKTLLEVVTISDLEAWKATVRNDTVNVGAV